jgi:TolB protein
MRRSQWVARLALGTALAIAASCSDAPTAPDPTHVETVGLQMSANVSGTPISTLVVAVNALDITTTLVFNLEVVEGIAQGTLKVPVGANRIFDVKAYDTDGEVTHEGSTTVNVKRGNNPPLSIPLRPVAGEVEITVSMGDYSVVVSPSSATLEVGQTQQLTVTVTDPDGQVVGDPVGWATLNPAIATVDGDGLVTAASGGTVDVVATYNGVAGKSLITVNGTTTTWYRDADGDTYGAPDVSQESSTRPEGYVDNNLDCNDASSSINPDAIEAPDDGVDNDCDGQVDEATSSSTAEIVFSRDDQLVLVNPDGTGVTPLPIFTGSQPDFSPDGSKIAFTVLQDVTTSRIHVVAVDGTGETILTTSGTYLDPDWSPDGSRIAFTRVDDGFYDIFVMDSDGTDITQLTFGVNYRQPDWSPDGSTLVVVQNLQLATLDAVDGTLLGTMQVDTRSHHEPAWSPDGSKIAIRVGCSGLETEGTDPCSGADGEIYVMNADGTSAVQLTDNTVDDLQPAWSPSGDRIVFRRGTVRDAGSDDLWVMNADGSSPLQVTFPGTDLNLDAHPSWRS